MEPQTIKIGILAQYLGTRNDVRLLINGIAQKSAVTVYLKEADKISEKYLNSNITFQYFSNKSNKLKHYFVYTLYKLFGKIPRSRNNYFVTENFKIANSDFKGIHRFIERFILNSSKFTPKFISYDSFLTMLAPPKENSMSEQHVFLCITQIYDDALFRVMIETGKKVFVYVYSWDHACKMKCFSKNKNVFYLVWSKEIHGDLEQLHGIASENIMVTGATQFVHLHQYLNENKISSRSAANKKYIYIPMATGTKNLTPEEVQLYGAIIQKIRSQGIDVKIIIRPYPFLKNWDLYASLLKLPNVEIEKDYRENENTQNVSEENLLKKYSMLQNASLVIHCGTTLGLEGSYLDVPVLFADLSKTMRLSQLDKFVHQFQNDKYLNLTAFPNVLKSIEDLAVLVSKALKAPASYLPYNIQCKKVAEVKSSGEIIKRFLEIMNSENIHV